MRILVIGSGGREHALAWKLSQEAEVVCAPGNPGIESDVETCQVDVADPVAVCELARHVASDLVVVGPEDPLVAGLADRLRAAGFATHGPGTDWARLEGSKAFSKSFMAETGVPTAPYHAFTNPSAAKEHAKRQYAEGRQLAVKASGTAFGKGVTVAENVEEATDAIERMMVKCEFGAAGETVVLEERLIGREFSVLTLIGDRNFVSLPVAQDHKRAFDGDQGPNTGGMGTYSPCDWLTPDLVQQVEATMVEPVFSAIEQRGGLFRGTLFTGVMVTDRGAFCLEFNVRFGDPEIQTVVMRLGSGFAEALRQTASGESIEPLAVLDNAAVTVVVASGGYPGSYKKGLPITVLPTNRPIDGSVAKLFWAGAGGEKDRLVTAGGRVVAATACATTPAVARALAYEAADSVRFDGAFYRRDIGSH